MRNLPEQLSKAGEWGRLQLSLTDLDYIEARCAAHEGEVSTGSEIPVNH